MRREKGGDRMMKKRYLMILSVAIISILLGSLLYNVTLAQKGKEPTQVNVVNLPLDEQGNLKVRTKQETFPETLVLRGAIVRLTDYAYGVGQWGYKYEYLLLDESTPFPNVVFSWFETVENAPTFTEIYNKTFVYETYGQKSYEIQGKVIVSTRWEVRGFRGSTYRGTFYFEKILQNGTVVTLASANIEETTVPSDETYSSEGGFTFSFETPITIDKYERIAVRLYIEAYVSGQAHFRQYGCLSHQDNDFLVIIPIIT